MSQWLQILNRFRAGTATRTELLAAVDASLNAGLSPKTLSASISEENDRSPLAADLLAAIQDRIRRSQDRTLLRPERSGNDATQLIGRNDDETQLLNGDALEVATRRAPVAVNSVLLGRFKLVQLIGEGGMSHVYKAIDLRRVEAGASDPHLAVKVLTVRFTDYFSSMAVLHREANKLQTLAHPNIVRVIDCDRDGQTVFMTMEYLDGISLKLHLLKNRSEDGLPREEALRIVGSIVAALEFAHGKGIVHGDLKLGNVIVTAAGDVKVIDFGIARFLRRPQDDGKPPPDDWAGVSALTPPYASPEMLEGADADPRDDVYALACITYELLTGEHPFGRTPATEARDQGLKPVHPRQLRAREIRAIQNGLQFERSKRTSGAREFLQELTGVSEQPRRRVAVWVALAIAALGASIYFGRSQMDSASPGDANLTAGTVFRDCPTCPLMRVMAPASFDQGSAAGSPDAQPYEQPVHRVTIPYPLAAGVHEVTVGEFSEFAHETARASAGCMTYDGEWQMHEDVSWRNATQRQTASYPVTCVSWQDAVDYATWLSARTGATYRVPSASEWEYLARAGSTSPMWSNPADACASANVADASAAQRFPGWTAFQCNDNYTQTAPVGTFEANSFGLHDTLGNVFEWVQDCWHDDYSGAPVDGSARLDGDCGQREARGGSWFTTPAFVRPGYRNRFDAGYRSSSVGFRLVREIRNEH